MAIIAFSGKKVTVTAGTRVVLGSPGVAQVMDGPIAIKALSTNTGLAYVGNATVSSTNGFQLAAGEVVILDSLGDLNTICIDTDVNGEGVTWLVLRQ